MSTTGDVTQDAIRLARTWLSATAEGQTARERRTTGRLAALVSDPAGLELAVRFVDHLPRGSKNFQRRTSGSPRASSPASRRVPPRGSSARSTA